MAVELARKLGEGLRRRRPVIGILLGFQFLILRQPLGNWREAGLVVFLEGIELGLTPLGNAFALTVEETSGIVHREEKTEE